MKSISSISTVTLGIITIALGFISILHAHKEADVELPWAFFISQVFDTTQLFLPVVVATLDWEIKLGLRLS